MRFAAIAVLCTLITTFAFIVGKPSCDELINGAWDQVPAECRSHPELENLRHGTEMVRKASGGNESYQSMDSLNQALQLLTRADSIWPEDADVDGLILQVYEEMFAAHPTSRAPFHYFFGLWKNGERDLALPYLASLVRSNELHYQQLVQRGFVRGDTLACLHFHADLIEVLDWPILIYENVAPLGDELPRLQREQAGAMRELAMCSASARQVVIDKFADEAYIDYLSAGRMEDAIHFANFIGMDSTKQAHLTRESRRVSRD